MQKYLCDKKVLTKFLGQFFFNIDEKILKQCNDIFKKNVINKTINEKNCDERNYLTIFVTKKL